MKQLSRNRLAQLQFSTLLQLAQDPEIKKLMKPEVKKTLEGITHLPESMIKSASFVIPDQPIAALLDQKITLKKLLNWYSSQQGGQAWLSKPSLHEETVNTAPDSSKSQQTEKNRAKNGLEFMTKFLTRASRLTEEANNRYEIVAQHWKTAASDRTLNADVFDKATQEMINEAANLSATTDFLALISLHYQKYLNEVTTAGFDVSAYKKITNPILDGNPPKYNSKCKDIALSFFTIPPNIMNDFNKFYESCNQLFCIANDEDLKKNHRKTGKPLYPMYAYSIYSRLQAPKPDWVEKHYAEVTAKALQKPTTNFSSDVAAWIIGFRESPDKNDKGGRARSPGRWIDEITRISVREEVLWREQETPEANLTQIFKAVAKDYGCTEDNVIDWFYRKNEKKDEKRKRDCEKK